GVGPAWTRKPARPVARHDLGAPSSKSAFYVLVVGGLGIKAMRQPLVVGKRKSTHRRPYSAASAACPNPRVKGRAFSQPTGKCKSTRNVRPAARQSSGLTTTSVATEPRNIRFACVRR